MHNSWFRHQFSATAENVTHVGIETGYADQLGDTSVEISACELMQKEIMTIGSFV